MHYTINIFLESTTMHHYHKLTTTYLMRLDSWANYVWNFGVIIKLPFTLPQTQSIVKKEQNT